MVSSLHSYIVVFSHWKILQKTIYFTGVPIEDEVNEVFLKSPKDQISQDARGLKSLQILVYFMGVPIEDKANKVNLEYGVHWQVLQNNLSENTSDFRLLYGHAYSK